MSLETSFDFRSDSRGQDPDKGSKTLKIYHKKLWSKMLPNGELFDLRDDDNRLYLTFRTKREVHYLTSDSIANSFSQRKKLLPLFLQLDELTLSSFRDLNSTIGGFIIFPGNRIDGKTTINGERGLNPYVADRFDLTLECIRRFYLEQDSPLGDVLDRYQSFFELFGDFKGYVDFFLLNDLVAENYAGVKFFNTLRELFVSSPLPDDIDSYLQYRSNSMLFTRNRNKRIEIWVKTGQSSNS